MKEPSKGIGKGGRPPHHPSNMDRRIVELAASYAVPTIKIAELLGISQKTLFKHYRTELDRGAARLEAALVLRIYALAAGRGDIALRAATFILKARFGWSPYLPPPR
ncbi:RNA polymerase subunit sigma-70 [Rhizobium ruizarguesonis]|uniref:RNA polymerase subunit sigma-70 n=1 Tax=Rhizobium ruizarguesonis TaxID=2081791 RepID=UPI001FE03BF5|nr:RNA polymerase subunit sigma-70 [Rhizobium ruizarguesonis]